MQGAITVDAERREETGIRRALVDIRKQQVTGPVMELYEFGNNIPSGMVFAVLGNPHSDDHKFVETVALNRGKNVRLFFGSEEDAIEWLMTDASDGPKR